MNRPLSPDQRTPWRFVVLLAIAVGGCTTVDNPGPPPEGQNPASAIDIPAGAATIQVVLERYTSGTVGVWVDPETDTTGSITPTRTYQAASGVYCREFLSEIEQAHRKSREEAVGCRTGDGVWEIYR